MATEYRIEYTIQRKLPSDEDFVDIGFGSSNGWRDIDAALYAATTDIQRREWETERGMPDPADVDTDTGSED